MIKLKPCPFCGGKATSYNDECGKTAISCDICGAMLGVECASGLPGGWMALYETPDIAVKAWNRRAAE